MMLQEVLIPERCLRYPLQMVTYHLHGCITERVEPDELSLHVGTDAVFNCKIFDKGIDRKSRLRAGNVKQKVLGWGTHCGN